MPAHNIPCRSAFGRPGECTVVVSEREAVLTVPPGEAARLSGPQLAQLIEVLHAVQDELLRSGS